MPGGVRPKARGDGERQVVVVLDVSDVWLVRTEARSPIWPGSRYACKFVTVTNCDGELPLSSACNGSSSCESVTVTDPRRQRPSRPPGGRRVDPAGRAAAWVIGQRRA